MPQFTQWNVPDPFPNILYNPAAVDHAIAQTQSELGNLDVNRQRLGLEQRKLDLQQSAGEGLLKSLGGDGTTGTTGAGVGGTYEPGTPFTPKMLPPGISLDEDAMVRTIAGEADNEPLQGQVAVAHVINNRAKGAGVSPRDVVFSPNQFEPWNGGAARARLEAMQPTDPAYQAILNNVVRPAMSGKAADPTGGATHFYAPVAQKALGREAPSWGQGTPSAVIGGHNFYKLGYGPGQARVAAAPDAAPAVAPQAAPGITPPTAPGVNPNAMVKIPPTTPAVVAPAANPNAGPRVGAASTVPAVTPAIAPSADPNARVEADDPNTAAVKQAATALLNMPEPDAAAAYPTVVRELQARGFAMQAPPTYPGHAALQALVGGGDVAAPAVEPSRMAMRLGGTDTAGPGAGQATVPTDVQPNRLAYGTDLPGVTIGMPGNGMAPPPAAAAPVVTATAPPAPVSAAPTRPPVVAPPQAPSRVIPLEPVLPNGLTSSQVRLAASMVKGGAPIADVAAHLEQWKQANRTGQQQAATQAAMDAQAQFERQKYYVEQQQKAEQTAYTRQQDTERSLREAEQLRLSQEGGTRDTARLDIERMKFEQGPDAQSRDAHTLKTADPSSQDYAEAWAHKKWTVAPNGNVIENDVSQYPAPTRSIQRPSFLPAPTPQALDEVRKADTDAKVITSAIDHYGDVFTAAGGGGWDSYIANPRDPKTQQLLGAFDRLKTVLRSPVYYNTGVLQPAEMELLKSDLVSPQTLRGVFATPEALATRLGEIKLAILTRQDAELRSIGKEGVIVRDAADFAKVPAGGKYYDENGHLRLKPEQR